MSTEGLGLSNQCLKEGLVLSNYFNGKPMRHHSLKTQRRCSERVANTHSSSLSLQAAEEPATCQSLGGVIR